MNTINIKVLGFAILASALLACFSYAAAADSDYDALARDLAQSARMNGISRVALGQFSAAGGTEEEARYASEKTATGLSDQKGLEIIDQSVLESYAGSKEGWLAKIPSKMRPQAFIRGSVFKDGEDLTIMTKLVDAASGRVLAALEIRAGARFTELPAVPDMNWGAPPALAALKNDFRDAPSDDAFNCEGAFKEMYKINAAAVDLKARYWARKMKEPGFAYGGLSRNPGSEIKDPQDKQKFYELLTKYHGDNRLPALPAAQLKKLEAFMEREDAVIDKCGIK